MNETYVECMIKRKSKPALKALKTALLCLAVLSFLVGFVALSNIIFLLVTIACGVGAYFCTLNAEIEYEYLYIDRQLTIDRIQNQSRRKTIAVYDLDRMEILAPLKSYQLDSYKNRTAKVIDYSSGEEKQPDTRFALYIDGSTKIVFEPSSAMIKAITMIAPRKVFSH